MCNQTNRICKLMLYNNYTSTFQGKFTLADYINKNISVSNADDEELHLYLNGNKMAGNF